MARTKTPTAMTSSPDSGSNSAAFSLLHQTMQRWVYDQGWSSLHDAQEQSIPILREPGPDLIISAATAAGKTEAAFLPILSYLMSLDENPVGGPDVLYVSPLKALINDQSDRLELMCEKAEIPVHRWHGDVGSARKTKARQSAGGVLLITPESLEAFFVLRGHETRQFFGRVKYVVIDELHSFPGTPRGAQLQSLLHRVELTSRHRPPRVGLSATLGEMAIAQRFLRPSNPDRVRVVVSRAEGELHLQIRGYKVPGPWNIDPEDPPSDEMAIADHLFETLRGSDNLVFANSRSAVERYAARLAEICMSKRVPNEFWPHHGSLAKGLREEVEQALKDRTRPVTAVCTSTLELGVDIGSVASVAQVGPPPSVAALRQRLGRSGRRGEPAVVRLYISEEEIDARTALVDHLRCDLIQTVAMVELLVAGWLESPKANGLNLSTLIQQTLSLIAQRGGVRPSDAHRVLCGAGPFEDVTASEFADLLRSMTSSDLVMQASDGLLLPGRQGERLINHYSFYAAFASSEEWRLVSSGATLGTIPIDHPVDLGGLLLFSGRRWRITAIDSSAKVITLERASGGNPPRFGGGGPAVSATVRNEMLRVLESDTSPAYLDRTAARFLTQARDAWSRFGLSGVGILEWDEDTFLLPWVGDSVLWAMTLALRREGLDAEPEGPTINVIGTDAGTLRRCMTRMVSEPAPTSEDLARAVENRATEKWDWALDTSLSVSSYARRYLDADMAWTTFQGLLRSGAERASGIDPVVVQPRTPRASTSLRSAPHIADVEFCVVDLETTGFSPRLGDRIIEIAAVRMRADGSRLTEWATLVDPERDVGPSHIHGISASDVVGAPKFATVAGDLLALLNGAVVVAHNLRFDWSFLLAEYERAGHPLPAIPAVCTLQLGTRVLPALADRTLQGCCAAVGVGTASPHAAAADAATTADLLTALLARAWDGPERSLEAINCEPLMWPAEMPEIPASGQTHQRGSHEHVDRQGSYLAQILADMPAHNTNDPDVAGYLEVLDRALEDRRLSEEEADELRSVAEEWGISTRHLAAVHRTYLRAMTLSAARDGVISVTERDDLNRVSRLLGVSPDEDVSVAVEIAPSSDDLGGLSVCFTGELRCHVDGNRLTRAMAEELAQQAGLEVHSRVTRELELLVVADPDTQSGKARKARANGTRIIAERAFWEKLGIDVS